MAIEEINLEGSNPVFGLNALGGALNVQLKNGFTYHGGEISFSGGSFGTFGGDFQYGKQSGNTAVYVAASGLHQDGWRDFQSSGSRTSTATSAGAATPGRFISASPWRTRC